MRPHVVVIGAGFTGLAAAYQLTSLGIRVTVLEADAEVGGLAGCFEVNGERLEKFYHHWFVNDAHILQLINELGSADNIVHRPTRTGMYFSNNFFKLSSPLDVLRFKPLSYVDRIRLGAMVLRARAVKDWRALESLTAQQWLSQLGGDAVYKVMWEPLLRGKFGAHAPEISAVWFWNKLKLRGGSRDGRGNEVLAYYRGGFAALARRMAAEIAAKGGEIRTGTAARALMVEGNRVTGVKTDQGVIDADAVIATPALPIIADLVSPHVPAAYAERLCKIQYLANICVVLELDRSLSKTYWLNVNDPGFPFVGVIEHTNFEPAETYGGRHIVYLSKYLAETDSLYTMSDAQMLEYALPHLQRMFPDFARSWILAFHVWHARYAQPIVTRGYRHLIPDAQSPLDGFYIASMAQIYPEDRGTNYAVREGRAIARKVGEQVLRPQSVPHEPALRA
ncbi:MAG TPA: NAD(P)/FAD-dependent oxidoreductase [Candidatus Sulfotelmatobacter sp.]|jgi:protoporphyrinogen oxidase|nr:NAD(P)/FAD-dependent oxidoreductase [Candidatus Sulfotelmatobacter sp.]